MIKENPDKAFNSLPLLGIFSRWKRLLWFTGIAAIAISASIAFTIPDQFKATSILYPSRYGSSAAILLNPWSERDMYQFGEEEDSERLMQLLGSDSLKEHVYAKFKLMEHYGIQPADKHARLKLLKQYEASVSVHRTDLMSVKVDVTDIDPAIAADIANEIATYADTIRASILKQTGRKAFEAVTKVYTAKKAAVKALEDSISKNPHSAISEGLAEMLKCGMKDLNDLETSYLKARTDLETPMSGIFIISRARAPQEKFLPVRSVIILLSLLSSLLLTIAVLVVYEQVTGKKE